MNTLQTDSLEQLVVQAIAAGDRSDHTALDRLGHQALELAHQLDRPDLSVKVHSAMSLSLYRRNDFPAALRHAAAAKHIGQVHNLPLARAEGQVSWARISWAVGDLDEALSELEAAHGPAMASQDFRTQVHVCNLLGLVHADLGQLQASYQFHQDALAAARLAHEADLELIALTNLAGRSLAIGEQARDEQRFGEAAAAWNRVLDLAQTTEALALTNDIQMGLPHFLVAYGAALRHLGKTEAALAVFDRLYRIVNRFADRSSLPHAAIQLGALYREQGWPEQARKVLHEGMAEAERLGAKARLSTLHLAACELEEANGQYRAALQHHKLFASLREECATEKARHKSMALAVKLDTQQALTQAEDARLRANQLQAANQALKVRADHLSRETLIDPLTDLGNRRLLDKQLPRMHRRARTGHNPLFAAMLDVDHFKLVNDRFSHAVGDGVLARLATLIRSMSRDGDLAVRYGGEEFVVVFQGTCRATSLAACERFRLAVEQADWSDIHPELQNVTVSLGLADLAGHADVWEGVHHADQMLYQAKADGRNRVCAADE